MTSMVTMQPSKASTERPVPKATGESPFFSLDCSPRHLHKIAHHLPRLPWIASRDKYTLQIEIPFPLHGVSSKRQKTTQIPSLWANHMYLFDYKSLFICINDKSIYLLALGVQSKVEEKPFQTKQCPKHCRLPFPPTLGRQGWPGRVGLEPKVEGQPKAGLAKPDAA
jgi:hypothetical protein